MSGSNRTAPWCPMTSIKSYLSMMIDMISIPIQYYESYCYPLSTLHHPLAPACATIIFGDGDRALSIATFTVSPCVSTAGWQSELQRFLTAWEESPPSMAFCTAICAAMGRQNAAVQAGIGDHRNGNVRKKDHPFAGVHTTHYITIYYCLNITTVQTWLLCWWYLSHHTAAGLYIMYALAMHVVPPWLDMHRN